MLMVIFRRSSTFLTREPPRQQRDYDSSGWNTDAEADLCAAAETTTVAVVIVAGAIVVGR